LINQSRACSKLKAAWQQLPFKVDGKEARAGVGGFVAGYAGVT